MDLYLKKQCSIALILYMGQMLVGIALGWTALLLPILEDPDTTPLPSPITLEQSSWIGSTIYIGTIAGPYISGYLSNARGRKPCLLLGGALVVLSFLLLVLAQNFAMIIAGRILIGLGTGMIFVINLVYIGEIASTSLRGILLTCTGIFSTLGTLVFYVVGPYAPYRISNLIGLVITMCFMAGVYFIPESPMFYILKEKPYYAKEVLINLGRGEDIDKLLNMKREVIQEKVDWRDLYRIKSNRKAFFITLTLSILQQLSGIIVVIFYMTSIFEMAGSSIKPHIATIIIGFTQVVSSSIAPFFVERNGRKVLLLWSTALSGLSLLVLGTFFLLDHLEMDVVQHLLWLPLVSLIVFFMSYDMGFGIIPGTLTGVLYQSNVRSIGSAITITLGWLFGFAVSTAFNSLITSIGGYGTFWLFSGSCALAFVFGAIAVPETKGKSLMEIERMLSKM